MLSVTVNEKLVTAAEAGDKDKVLELLASGADPRSRDSAALRVAASHGHEECVRLLLPVSNPNASAAHVPLAPLMEAACAGHVECVRLLLPMSDTKARGSLALRVAVQNGHVECARLLLPVSDAAADDCYALRVAALNGRAECLTLLLPVSDAKALGSQALRLAVCEGHAECVRMLISVSGPLCEIEGLLDGAMSAGQAKVAALLIGEEPRLLDGVDLLGRREAAIKNNHGDMASLLLSIEDQKELSSLAPGQPARGGLRHQRL